MNVKLILTGLISAGAGFAAGWFIKKHLDDKMFEDLVNYYTSETEEDSSDVEINPEETEETLKQKAEDAAARYRGDIVPEKVVITEEDRHPVDSDEDDTPGESGRPYLITAEQYEDDVKHWDKVEYVYSFAETELRPYGVLVDDTHGCVVTDPKYDIGYDNADLKGFFDDQDGAVMFVRNPVLGCDFMIIATSDELDEEEYDGIPIDHEGGEK